MFALFAENWNLNKLTNQLKIPPNSGFSNLNAFSNTKFKGRTQRNQDPVAPFKTHSKIVPQSYSSYLELKTIFRP